MLDHVASELPGSFIALIIMMKDKIIGREVGKLRLCASSDSSLTALPTGAKS